MTSFILSGDDEKPIALEKSWEGCLEKASALINSRKILKIDRVDSLALVPIITWNYDYEVSGWVEQK